MVNQLVNDFSFQDSIYNINFENKSNFINIQVFLVYIEGKKLISYFKENESLFNNEALIEEKPKRIIYLGEYFIYLLDIYKNVLLS